MARLEARTLTQKQIKSITEFAAKIRGGLLKAEDNFEIRRRFVEMLDVRATFVVENGKKIAYVQGIIWQEKKKLLIASDSMYNVMAARFSKKRYNYSRAQIYAG